METSANLYSEVHSFENGNTVSTTPLEADRGVPSCFCSDVRGGGVSRYTFNKHSIGICTSVRDISLKRSVHLLQVLCELLASFLLASANLIA